MTSHGCPRDAARRTHSEAAVEGRLSAFLRRWFWANSLIAGLFALVWLVLRSGTKPSRFAYPCQQAAVSAATLAFGAPLIGALLAARRGIVAALRRPAGIAAAALGLVATAGLWGYLARADAPAGPRLEPRDDYVAQVYHVSECPQNPIGARFVGVDNLLSVMGREGLKFYESATESLWAGPGGIIAPDDVVVIKINYQWDQRGGTNVDVLRGVIHRLVNHPNGFTGEIAVCENVQFVGSASNFDRSANNAQVTTMSPHDVVVEFQGLGYNVSHYDWTLVRTTQVQEYSAGNMTDGYVVYPYDAVLHGAISYPKFRTASGTYISLKYGIWDPFSQTYDRPRLKFINMPVLKSHSIYGVTADVKDHMGTVTGSLSTNSHSAIAYGILGALLGEIEPAALNILDCIWINAIPGNGPSTSYANATRRDELVASLDPVAADMWAVTNILVPAFIDNGYSPPFAGADPTNPNTAFRNYLDNSMDRILTAGYDATNDLGQIDASSWNGDGDFDLDSDVDLADFAEFAVCFTGSGGPVEPGCEAGDFDDDNDIDCTDWEAFVVVWTEPEPPPFFEPCAQEVARPMADDAFDINGTVHTCSTDEDCIQEFGPGTQAGCVPAPVGDPGPGVCYVARNRYISLNPNPANTGLITARRVSLDLGGGQTHVLGWIGEPFAVAVTGGETSLQLLARIEADPYYRDWSVDDSGAPYADATLHLGDCEVSPGQAYLIQSIIDGFDIGNEGNYSEPLLLTTVAAFGDVVGVASGEPPDGDRSFKDIAGVVRGFQSAQLEPKAWLDLRGDAQMPEVPDLRDISFLDIQQAVLGFQGATYPFAAPCECPGQSCP